MAPRAGTATAGGPVGRVELEVRPLRIRLVAAVVAIVVLAFFTVGAVLVHHGSSGFAFRTADQVSMIVLGGLLALGALLFTRPRLRAGPGGIEVRAVVVTRRVDWADVLGVSFPDGAQFARLDLPDDEYLTVSALQAVDGPRAVRGVGALRELHARHHRDPS